MNRPLRVAVDARTLRPPLSGVGRCVLSWLRAMAAHPSRPELTCFVDRRDIWDAQEWPAHCRALDSGADLESHPWGDWAYHARLPKRVAGLEPRPDVFWGPAFQVPWGKRFPVPRVVAIHDMAAFLCPETMPAKFAFYLRAVVKRSVRAADRVVAVSEATRRDLLQLLSVPPEKVSVIGEGPLLAGERLEPRPPADFPLGEPFWLFVGAFEPRKNIGFLLEVFEALRRQGDPRRLVLCGPPGWKNEGLSRRLEASEARGAILRLGRVPDAELTWLYQRADALLMPSLHEGFGLPPLEAAAFGTPALVSDRGALPEAAFSPEWVLPLDAGAWTERLASLERPSSEELKRHASRFSWEKAAEEWLRLMEEIRIKS
jgi:glycosyltransferase involved in cell wall biosynthesis